MLKLVLVRAVEPYSPGRVDVTRPHQDHFARPHPRSQLELDHRKNLPVYESSNGEDIAKRHRLDVFRIRAYFVPPGAV